MIIKLKKNKCYEITDRHWKYFLFIETEETKRMGYGCRALFLRRKDKHVVSYEKDYIFYPKYLSNEAAIKEITKEEFEIMSLLYDKSQ